MKTLNIKSLLTLPTGQAGPFDKGEFYPSLAKRGEGRFYKINFLLLLCLSISIVLAGLSVFSLKANAVETKDEKKNSGSKVVAKVNGKSIYEDQIAPDVNRILRKYRKYGMKSPDSDFIKNIQISVLDKIIDQEVLLQESLKIEISDIDKKADEKILNLRKQYKSEEDYIRYLKMKNLTPEKQRELVKTNIYTDEFLSKDGLNSPVIAETEIKDYYEKNKGAFKRQETVKVSHILINTEKISGPEEKEQAKIKAENIRKEILDGKDFAEIAKKYSECNSAQKGGDLGYIEKGYMPEEFDKVAFSLKTGDLSEIVQTRFGFHIIKVVDWKPEGIVPFDEVRDTIVQLFKKDLIQKNIALCIQKLREKAKIEILL